MKTQEQKLQHIMEAAGYKLLPHSGYFRGQFHGKVWYLDGQPQFRYPKKSDLNLLFRLAEKLGFDAHLWRCNKIAIRGQGKPIVAGKGETLAEALLNALFIATGGKD